ncbi:MAG: hypothetical protein K6C13_06250 [Oscillospiraceae bacterium]|nr:hypothetical protein [Oscillospiraceae bacterium]
MNADGNIFLQTLSYYQNYNGDIFPEEEYLSQKFRYSQNEGRDTDLSDSLAHRLNMRLAEIRNTRMGKWYETAEEIVIPSIEIFGTDEGHEVFWYSMESSYFPFGKGYNVNFDRKGSHVKRKRVKCERAFVVNKGEAGVLRYNYRFSHGAQHYEQYCIYIVDTDILDHNTFTSADYKKEYDEMAYLL